ncbi:aldose epimerase family protein [uncultured Enterovirga sp.]|uniref:aldose epimerase family protein n=1 Tax=uncultured Enterovirga sp. TaxID=2026352 RepID=UPI0035C95160
MSVRPFGRAGDQEVVEVTLAADGIEAKIITWGAVLRDLSVPGRAARQRAVLGWNRLEDYVASPANFGAVVGRYANRIGQARFRLGGREFILVPNENGHALHGGPAGFGRRVWSLVSHDTRRAHLALVSEAGDMGYPGRLHVFATYEIAAPAILRLSLQAFADEPTPVNLTSHTYFNLDGSPDARDHRLELAADFFLRTDAELIPTGEVASVAGTPFDFRRERPIRHPGPAFDLDALLVIRRERAAEAFLAKAARLSSPVSGVAMDLWTTEIGLQVYDGNQISDVASGLDHQPYRRNAGIALETQRFPNAPNHAHFPACTLRTGEVSRQVTEWRFSLAGP